MVLVTDYNRMRSRVTLVKVKVHLGQGQIRVPNKGRWAHINVKLLHVFVNLRSLKHTAQFFMTEIILD